jgi:hypothetical protein
MTFPTSSELGSLTLNSFDGQARTEELEKKLVFEMRSSTTYLMESKPVGMRSGISCCEI